VIVVTRLPRTDAQEAERLRAILRARPDAIVLHVGVPDAAPDHRHQVRTYGGGRAVLRAAVDLLLTAAPDSSTSS
jgi:beta-N-acetylhexosaminidase